MNTFTTFRRSCIVEAKTRKEFSLHLILSRGWCRNQNWSWTTKGIHLCGDTPLFLCFSAKDAKTPMRLWSPSTRELRLLNGKN